jgi:hypothetical protein
LGEEGLDLGCVLELERAEVEAGGLEFGSHKPSHVQGPGNRKTIKDCNELPDRE